MFYLNDNSNGLILSSNVSSLILMMEDNERKISQESLYNYLNLSYLIGDKTFNQVKQLEPSSYLVFDKNTNLKNKDS